MKLYTEEQVREMLNTFLLFTGNEDANHYIEYMTPFELPTDEEIGQEFKHYSDMWEVRQALEVGAKWMRDKIQGGNK